MNEEIDSRAYLKIKRILSDFHYMKYSYIDEKILYEQIQRAIADISTIEQTLKTKIEEGSS